MEKQDQPGTPPTPIIISEEERSHLASLGEVLNKSKIALADAALMLFASVERVGIAGKEFRETVQTIGKAHGITMNKDQRWDYDIKAGVFNPL